MAIAAAITIGALTFVLLWWISLHGEAWMQPPRCRSDLAGTLLWRRAVSTALVTTPITPTGSTLVLGIVDIRHPPARRVYRVSIVVAWLTMALLVYLSWSGFSTGSVKYR
jgi:hypothetical protein